MPKKTYTGTEKFKRLRPSSKRELHTQLIRAAKNAPYPTDIVVNGQPQPSGNAPRKVAITRGIAVLESESVIQAPIIQQKTNNTAEIFLSAINIQVLESNRDFTLLSNPESSINLNKSLVDASDEYGNQNTKR